MAKSDDGGPAFPVNIKDPEGAFVSPGMSLRDWFAGRAIQGEVVGLADSEMPEIARRAYAFADVMLRERGRK